MKTAADYHKNWMLRIAAALFCLVLVSARMLTGLWARYTTAGTGGDQARVAKFDVTGTSAMSETFAIVMKPGDSTKDLQQRFSVVLDNNSEVKVNYNIALELEGNLPLEITLDENGSGTQAGSVTSSDTPKLEKSGKGWKTTYPANAATEASYQFYLTWPEGKDSYKYSEGIASVKVIVTAVQED